MESISAQTAEQQEYVEEIKRCARKAAVQERLPWALKKLWEKGIYAVRKTMAGGAQYASGWPSRREYVKARIRQELWQAARTTSNPTPESESIKNALQTFSAKEWETLIARFGSRDLDPLLEHLHSHIDALAAELGREKYRSVYHSALRRWATLLAPESEGVEISAPVQAALLWHSFRQLNVAGKWVPEDRYLAIANVLGSDWTRRRVQLMLDRMREDEYLKAFLDRDGPEPDLEGDVHIMLLRWANGKYAQRRHQRRRSRKDG